MTLEFSESIAKALGKLSEKPSHFPGCCPAISKPLLDAIVEHLPRSPALTLSIGSGSGLLEAMLLQASQRHGQSTVNLCGVEVDSCLNRYLTEGRLLRVTSTSSLHFDAMLASTLMFVYPRNATIIAMYLDAVKDGALRKVIWLGPVNDWPDVEERLRRDFTYLWLIDCSGLAEYELLGIASME